MEDRSAGGVVVRRGPETLEVVVAEQHDRNLRVRTVRLPKGHPDPDESDEAAALREVEEETGLRARVIARLPDVTYRYHERKKDRWIDKRVVFFLMAHEGGEPRPADGEMDRVYWTPLEDAASKLHFDTERQVVGEALALLESSHPPRL